MLAGCLPWVGLPTTAAAQHRSVRDGVYNWGLTLTYLACEGQRHSQRRESSQHQTASETLLQTNAVVPGPRAPRCPCAPSIVWHLRHNCSIVHQKVSIKEGPQRFNGGGWQSLPPMPSAQAASGSHAAEVGTRVSGPPWAFLFPFRMTSSLLPWSRVATRKWNALLIPSKYCPMDFCDERSSSSQLPRQSSQPAPRPSSPFGHDTASPSPALSHSSNSVPTALATTSLLMTHK